MQDTSLKIQFPELFHMSSNPLAKVADHFKGGTFKINFRRTLTASDSGRFEELKTLMSHVSLDNTDDEVHWVLERSKNFTTKSLYRFIKDGDVRSKVSKEIWKSKVP